MFKWHSQQTNKQTSTQIQKNTLEYTFKENIQQKNMQNESIIEISIQTIHNINNLRCKDVKFKYEIDRFKKKHHNPNTYWLVFTVKWNKLYE